MRKSFGWVLRAAAWAAASTATLLLAFAFVPTLFGFEALIVASGSMGRSMPVGSVALTRPIEAHAVAVGDIVSFRRRDETQTTTHRAIAVLPDGPQVIITTKGDANGSPDPEPVVIAARIHRVEYVVPFVGYLVRFARSPLGGIALFAVPIVGLTMDRPIKAARARRRRRRQSEDIGWSWTTFAFEHLAATRLGSPRGG